MKCSKVLITGANGLLGSAVVEAFRLRSDARIIGVGHHEMDITDVDHLMARVEGFEPDLVINCAAYTKVDDCEINEKLAMAVNGEGAGNMAQAARAVGADLIHISTDYIFDGTATSPILEYAEPAPPEMLSAYGRSKLLGERLVRQYHGDAVIVRTAWLYGREGPSFPKAILQRAKSGLPLRVVTDQTGAPTFANDLALGLLELVQHKAGGTYHFTNAGSCTWHAYACELLKQSGIVMGVEEITSQQLGRPAKRPAYSVLDMTRFIADTGMTPRTWQEALAEYLRG